MQGTFLSFLWLGFCGSLVRDTSSRPVSSITYRFVIVRPLWCGHKRRAHASSVAGWSPRAVMVLVQERQTVRSLVVFGSFFCCSYWTWW